MAKAGASPARGVFIWSALAAAAALPVIAASTSPFLAWREPIYIGAGFAGIIAFSLMLFQPLLAAGYLPGVSVRRGRMIHRGIGVLVLLAVIAHVAGLWITSPPDVVDALLFRSPTSFSVWGVVAMWAVFASALLAVRRRRVGPRIWRRAHTALALIIVVGTALHALLIEGAMETITKAGLCALVIAVTAKVVFDLRAWALRSR